MIERAVIDIGSNSTLLLIGQKDGEVLRPVLQKVACPRVGRGVATTGRINPEAHAALTAALLEFMEVVEQRGTRLAAAVATEAFRKASNGPELLVEISGLLGVPCRILSGEQEARLSYLAVRSLYSDPNLWVLDIGGGSTEVNTGSWCRSLPLGAVGFTEKFGSNLDVAVDKACEAFSNFPEIKEVTDAVLVTVGGTASALALLAQNIKAFSADTVEGFTTTLAVVKQWRQRLGSLSVAEKNALPGLDSGRGEILGAGLAIWEGFLLATGFTSARVSDRGLRYGLLWESWEG